MPLGLLLSDDLIFISRITATGRSLGLPVKSARTADALIALAEREPPSLVILDLHNPGLDLPALLQRLGTKRPRVVAYGSHVEAATLKAARDAGCDLVLPRSKFVEDLEQILSEPEA